MANNRVAHWNKVFEEKDTTKVSWYQATPFLSVALVTKYLANLKGAIIDIGGGDSALPKALLALNYEDISLLDISAEAIRRNHSKLAADSSKVYWIESDVTKWVPERKYNLWFDRAVFHFLNEEADQLAYKRKALAGIEIGGYLIIGAFSKNGGPTKCSGIEVAQQDKASISQIFDEGFDWVENFEMEHETPSGSSQMFNWSVLIRV